MLKEFLFLLFLLNSAYVAEKKSSAQCFFSEWFILKMSELFRKMFVFLLCLLERKHMDCGLSCQVLQTSVQYIRQWRQKSLFSEQTAPILLIKESIVHLTQHMIKNSFLKSWDNYFYSPYLHRDKLHHSNVFIQIEHGRTVGCTVALQQKKGLGFKSQQWMALLAAFLQILDRNSIVQLIINFPIQESDFFCVIQKRRQKRTPKVKSDKMQTSAQWICRKI